MITRSPEQQWESMPAWMGGKRRFESAETNRLNSAHWTFAKDESVNAWLQTQLETMRARSHYEAKQNGMILGMINTHADDVVGVDGPTLQVISDDPEYNAAVEEAWQAWFAAPTPDPTDSGATLLKSWVKALWKNGEYLGQLVTDRAATGPVQLRFYPRTPRLLTTPADYVADSQVFMGIRFNEFRRPTQYYFADETISGTTYNYSYQTWPADLVVHGFVKEEEGQVRGIPWCNTALTPSADLRDYDDQVQDAARQIADSCGMFYTERDDVTTWPTPESVDIERRTIKTAPPGWKPWQFQATQPPVQYPEYRAERMREFGRPVSMPLARIRLDYSRYNFSSARLEVQNYYSSVGALQHWISGTPKSFGTLNRLVDEVVKESRFLDPRLRRRPARVSYQWSWPKPPHVDPTKEANAEGTALANNTISLIDALAARGTDLETHIAKLQRVVQAFETAGLAMPKWLADQLAADPVLVEAISESLSEEAVTDE